MSERTDRFRRRRETLDRAHERGHLVPVADAGLVAEVLAEPVDWESIREVERIGERHYTFDLAAAVSDEEVEALLVELRGRFDGAKLDDLARSYRDTVLGSIVKPFGLARILFEDHDGGNVTTEVGARKAYEDRSFKVAAPYQREDYEAGPVRTRVNAFKGSRTRDGRIRDAYARGEVWLDAADADTDHGLSTAEFHAMGGFMLDPERKCAFAADDGNYAITGKGTNRSKGARDGREWAARHGNGRKVANREHHGTDGRKLNAAVDRGHRVAQRHLPTRSEKAAYYVEETVATGLEESARMGLQQAVGMMIHELVVAAFDEIKDIYGNGYRGGRPDATFFAILRERLMRVVERVAARWKDVTRAFADGALSGFLSNVVTVVVNKFVATGKRIVRIIREGFFSLLRALKLIVSPPEGMSARQACHEATKLIAAGLTVAGGVLLEEGVEDYLMGLIPPGNPLTALVPAASAVCVGMATGLVTVFLVYALDKIDLFGAQREARHTQVMETLGSDLDRLFEEGEALLASMDIA